MSAIQNVSDTAIWVAYYRALESERPDALFFDPFAKKLVGERGRIIAKTLKETAKYTQSTIVLRTWIIDRYIEKLVAEGVDTVINLGAGLDTRPYRLDLPSSLKWVEVDYPHMIEYKEEMLRAEKPRTNLERIALDLTKRPERQKILARLSRESRRALILTEGVIPYLDEEQVASLADDLREHPAFAFWIAEYTAPTLYRFFRHPRRMKEMRNAPLKFYPPDWFGFFRTHGWEKSEVRFMWEELAKLNRAMPVPWWVHLLKLFMSKKVADQARRQFGYVVFRPAR